jgi:LasA protease
MKYDLKHFRAALFFIIILLLTAQSACAPLWGSTLMLATNQLVGKVTPEETSEISVQTPTAEFIPTKTNTPEPTFTQTPIKIEPSVSSTRNTGSEIANIIYYSQAGDSLPVVAIHFGVNVSEIYSEEKLPEEGFIDPNTLLSIPSVIFSQMSPDVRIMPDSEVVFSPSAIDFDVFSYVAAAGGYLNHYSEWVTRTTTGVEVVNRQAIDNSINPRLLLALLEYQSGWVTGQPTTLASKDYPLGYIDLLHSGLFNQYLLAAKDLSIGYYGWRSGQLTELSFVGGERIRLAPDLNAGTVALMYYFSIKNSYADWLAIIDQNIGFVKMYENMFGDPWIRAQKVEPLFPPGLIQPTLNLPFSPGETWSLTGGPHAAWEMGGAQAALDFAPASDQKGCYDSDSWVLASASGLVVRSSQGVVILDLDNDGYEQTGWDLLYLHIAEKDRVKVNTLLNADDRVGHPSCEGGVSTGTHTHFARKFNGEWILADGPLPFNLSGWIAHAGLKPYEGTMTKGDRTIVALPNGSNITTIIREPGD